MNGPQAIDEYLDELLFHLRGREPSLVRRVMRETEDHLRDCAAAHSSEGASPKVSESKAIAAFGPAKEFAGTFPPWSRPMLTKVVARQVLLAMGVLMITVGLSGVMLLGLRQWVDAPFVVREGSAVIQLPATGPCGYLETDRRPETWCPREAFENLEAEAMRRQVLFEARWQLATGFVGLVFVATGLRIKRSLDFRQRGLPPAWRAAALASLGLFGAFFLYMGWSWGQTQGKQGEGWFYAWGIAAALTFLASTAWLAVTSGKAHASGVAGPFDDDPSGSSRAGGLAVE